MWNTIGVKMVKDLEKTVAENTVHLEYISKNTDDIKDTLKTLASKRELNIHRGLFAMLWAAFLWLVSKVI